MLKKESSSINECFCKKNQLIGHGEFWSYEEDLNLIDYMSNSGFKNRENISYEFKICFSFQFDKHYIYFAPILQCLRSICTKTNSKLVFMNYSSDCSAICDENQNEFSTDRSENQTKEIFFPEINPYKESTDMINTNVRCDKTNDCNVIENSVNELNESIQYDGVFDFEMDNYVVDFKQENLDDSCSVLSYKTINSDIQPEKELNFGSCCNSVYRKELVEALCTTSDIDGIFNIQSSLCNNYIEEETVSTSNLPTKNNVPNFCNNDIKNVNTVEQNFLLPKIIYNNCHSQPFDKNSSDCSSNLIENVDSVASSLKSFSSNIKTAFNSDGLRNTNRSGTNIDELLEIEKYDNLLVNCNMVTKIDEKIAVKEVDKLFVNEGFETTNDITHQNCYENIIDPCDIKIESDSNSACNLNVQDVKNYELRDWSTNDSSFNHPNFLNNVFISNYQLNNDNFICENFHSKNTLDTSSLMTDCSMARNDFNVEFDNDAEKVLTYLSNNDGLDNDDLIKQLPFAIISGYNFRLSEQSRKTRIVSRYELINSMKTISWYDKYKNNLGGKLMKNVMRYLQFIDLETLEGLLRDLRKLNEVKRRLYKLFKYRQNGLTRLSSVELFELMNKQRDESLKMLHFSVPSVTFTDSGVPIISPSARRPAPPIMITNMPGYSALDETESEFCSVNRILPNLFMQFKEILINECNKKNGIKLAQARVLLKIDVNKTRKLYDFLLKQKLIWLPISNI